VNAVPDVYTFYPSGLNAAAFLAVSTYHFYGMFCPQNSYAGTRNQWLIYLILFCQTKISQNSKDSYICAYFSIALWVISN
jgi:hypothetical protein